MDFLALAKQRESVRAYLDKPIAQETLLSCVEAAILAPSACNSQPWKMVIVNEPTLLKATADAIAPVGKPLNQFVHQVPAVVVVVQEPAVLMKGANVDSKRWVEIDNGSAIEHFCLQAAALGLGTCILGSFDEEKIKELVSVPKDREVKVVIAVGYPQKETPRTKARRSLEQVVSMNQYQ